jgi:hypothetical protein
VSTEKITDAEIFSERLRMLRKSRKKIDFARFLNTSPQNYGRYENGRIPDTVTLGDIANRCGVTIDWLLGRCDFDGQNTVSGTSGQPCPQVEKGQNDTPAGTSGQPCPQVEKGQDGACRYPENCDLPHDLQVMRERMESIEGRLDHMGVQLETLCGLLGHALAGNMAESARKHRKAG